jgi:hypothetical protein
MSTIDHGSPEGAVPQVSVPTSDSALPYFLPLRIRRIWLAVLIFAGAFFSLGLFVDWLLIHARWVSQIQAAAIIDGFFALVVAALIYKVLAHDRERRMKVVERLETIDEMNHHIRNALQVISFNAHPESNDFELAEMKRAMNRIQWALREILPRVEPEFAAFEGSARDQAEKTGPKSQHSTEE